MGEFYKKSYKSQKNLFFSSLFLLILRNCQFIWYFIAFIFDNSSRLLYNLLHWIINIFYMKNILLVDDEDINRLYISSYLKKTIKFPYKLHQEINWYWAINAAKHNIFDVVIMDYQMPEMNWAKAMYELRNSWWGWLWIWYTAYAAYDMQNVWQHFLDVWANKVFLKHDQRDDMLNFINNTIIKGVRVIC